MLAATSVVVGAWEGDRLVGFARAMSDGVYRALVDDVVVDQDRRGKGVGDELVRRLLDRLAGVEAVFLRCGEDLVPYYARHGFERARNVTMDRR
jgi:predicted GNAT family N-acyltransferase